jgi:hypothetical protein
VYENIHQDKHRFIFIYITAHFNQPSWALNDRSSRVPYDSKAENATDYIRHNSKNTVPLQVSELKPLVEEYEKNQKVSYKHFQVYCEKCQEGGREGPKFPMGAEKDFLTHVKQNKKPSDQNAQVA